MNKLTKEQSKRFDDRFVYIDAGPDADGYDTEPDCWDEEKYPSTDEAQIEVIKQHLADELARQKVKE